MNICTWNFARVRPRGKDTWSILWSEQLSLALAIERLADRNTLCLPRAKYSWDSSRRVSLDHCRALLPEGNLIYRGFFRAPRSPAVNSYKIYCDSLRVRCRFYFLRLQPRFFSFADGVKAKVFIRAKPFLVQGRRYLRLQQLKMDFSVQNIKMGVENVRDSNSILRKFQLPFGVLVQFSSWFCVRTERTG